MIRLGIAGIGTIANDYIGLIQAGKVQGVRISALSSRSAVNMARAIETHRLEKTETFADYQAMLTQGSIDAVLICTPHREHPAMARLAIDRGLHVLVEKPLGVDPAEVSRLVESHAARPEIVGGVMYNRRQSDIYQRAKTLLEAKAIGELVRVTWLITNLYRPSAYYRSSPWRGTWRGEGGGLLMTQASHQLDLLQWLCGMPLTVQAQCRTVGREIEVENEASLLLTFAGSASGHFLASAHETPGTNRLEICGTLGRLVIENDRALRLDTLAIDERLFVRSADHPFAQPALAEQAIEQYEQDNLAQQAAALQNFIDTIDGRATIACSLQEAVHSLSIIQAAYLSDWTGRIISIPADEQLFRAEMSRRGGL